MVWNQGGQGEKRRPHDHNRDYGDAPLYSSVKAIKQRVVEWADGKLKIVLDLHCPYVNGDGNESVYLVGLESDYIWNGQQAFSEILERSVAGGESLPFSSADNLQFGKGWNSPENYSKGKNFTKWIAEAIPNVKLVTTIEVLYAKAGGIDVTPASAARFGAILAESSRSLLSGRHS